MAEKSIMVIGHYHKGNHEASRVVYGSGVFPTMKDNHGTLIAVIKKWQRRKKSR